MLETFSLATFEPLVGSAFTLKGAEQSILLTLIEAKAHARANTESFSLLFQGPTSPVAFQATHRLEHPILGVFDLFLGPVHVPGFEGIPYQAVFNRLLPTP